MPRAGDALPVCAGISLTSGEPVATLAFVMRSSILRYSALGVLVLGVIAALLWTWQVSHVWFVWLAVVVGIVVLSVVLVMLTRDGWRQTSPESLNSRGFRPGTVSGMGVMDPGLRRDYSPILPAAVTRRRTATRAPRPAARPAVRPAVAAVPARSGRARRRNEALQPDATITLAAERQAAGIDDL